LEGKPLKEIIYSGQNESSFRKKFVEDEDTGPAFDRFFSLSPDGQYLLFTRFSTWVVDLQMGFIY